MSRRSGRRRRIRRGPVPGPTDQLPDRAADPCGEPARTPKRRGRHSNGGLEQPVVRARAFRRCLFRARILPPRRGNGAAMNMAPGVNAMDVVVLIALALALIFVAAWGLSPRLRAWIERPKYRFQENLRSYDETARMAARRRNESR